jgi:uncharacterized membrane protein YraQ (UPF0718 family)
MSGILLDIRTTLLSNGWQILVGTIIAIPLYFLPRAQWEKGSECARWKRVFIVALSAGGGMILPLGIYGVIPIAIALLARGLSFSLVLPLLVSNLLFNMLVPYADPSFIWRTGIFRVIFAWFAGVAVGVWFAALKSDACDLLKGKEIKVFPGESVNLKNIIMNSGRNIIILACCLIPGAVINSVFHRVLWVEFIQILYTSPQTAYLPRLFASLNVTNPFFLLALTIAGTLMDLTRLSALFAILKPKGVVLYITYHMAWAILLTTTIFFR